MEEHHLQVLKPGKCLVFVQPMNSCQLLANIIQSMNEFSVSQAGRQAQTGRQASTDRQAGTSRQAGRHRQKDRQAQTGRQAQTDRQAPSTNFVFLGAADRGPDRGPASSPLSPVASTGNGFIHEGNDGGDDDEAYLVCCAGRQGLKEVGVSHNANLAVGHRLPEDLHCCCMGQQDVVPCPPIVCGVLVPWCMHP